MQKNEQINVGDLVSFSSKKGKVTGTVSRLWVRKNKKAQRLHNAFGGPNDPAMFTTEMADVVPNGQTAYWKVPVSNLKIEGKGAGDVEGALDVVGTVKQSKANRRKSILERNLSVMVSTNLIYLEPGDSIQVKFTNRGWLDRQFVKFAPSGKVGFSDNYSAKGYRYSWPKFVRATPETQERINRRKAKDVNHPDNRANNSTANKREENTMASIKSHESMTVKECREELESLWKVDLTGKLKNKVSWFRTQVAEQRASGDLDKLREFYGVAEKDVKPELSPEERAEIAATKADAKKKAGGKGKGKKKGKKAAAPNKGKAEKASDTKAAKAGKTAKPKEKRLSNEDLVFDLIVTQGKDEKAVISALTERYAAKGQTDPDYIKARAAIYIKIAQKRFGNVKK